MNSSLAPATQIVYNKALTAFHTFAFLHHFDPFGHNVATSHIALFVAHLFHQKLAHSTISTYLSAIGYAHKLLHNADPTSSFLVKKLISGARRLHPTADMRLPITVHILDDIVHAASMTSTTVYFKILFQAMFLFAFNAFARIGEITLSTSSSNNLLLSDVKIEGGSHNSKIHVIFQRFKHNTNNTRHEIVFGHGPTRVSAALSLIQYLALRGNQPGSLFVRSDNSPITRSQFDKQLHACLAFCKLDSSRYKGHSFRIGAASYAAEQGCSDAKICSMGRWKSAAFRKYVRSNIVT